MDMENHTGTGQDRPDKLKIVPLFNVLIQIKMTKKSLEDGLMMYLLKKCIVNLNKKVAYLQLRCCKII